MRSFPSDQVPDGWYQIGWTADFPAQEPKPLSYFDRDLVAYRAESGELKVLDAFCRHMGAHLGHGGCVEGEAIRCPYHGWKWEPDGSNSDIPYGTQQPMRNLRLTAYPTFEIDGVVLTHFSQDGSPPLLQLPDAFNRYGEDTWALVPETCYSWPDIAMAPQMFIENQADAAHFRWVHRASDVAEVGEYSFDEGPFKSRINIRFGGDMPSTWATPNGPVDGHIYTEGWSLGLGWSQLVGFDDVIFLLGVTPITPLRADLRSSCWVRRTRGDGTEMSEKVRDRWVKQQNSQVDADLEIWKNQTYIDRAPFTADEQSGIRAVRKWARQFYSGRDDSPVDSAAPEAATASK